MASPKHDPIVEFAGNGDDQVYGLDNDDRLHGENGRDQLWGRQGDDRLFGGNGKDALYGGDDDDLLRGENGKDLLVGGDGADGSWGLQRNARDARLALHLL